MRRTIEHEPTKTLWLQVSLNGEVHYRFPIKFTPEVVVESRNWRGRKSRRTKTQPGLLIVVDGEPNFTTGEGSTLTVDIPVALTISREHRPAPE